MPYISQMAVQGLILLLNSHPRRCPGLICGALTRLDQKGSNSVFRWLKPPAIRLYPSRVIFTFIRHKPIVFFESWAMNLRGTEGCTHSRDGNRTILLHTHPPYLRKIRQSQTHFSDALLHEGRHTVFYGLLFQLFYL
jgi:hypothetical protein